MGVMHRSVPRNLSCVQVSCINFYSREPRLNIMHRLLKTSESCSGIKHILFFISESDSSAIQQ
jgi:hypothetical protein